MEVYVCNALYLINVTTIYFLSNITPSFLSFNTLSTNNQVMLNSITSITELVSYIQAAHHPGFQKSMNKELESL